ncbi:MAG: hypothetical protein MUF72_00920 [Elainella sp. Prado103]|jgi:hypothetical protein|nr:hypothetical protein [Elainella sp. Prado103]
MNKDAEAIDQFLAWLSQEPNPVTPSGKVSNPFRDLEHSGEVNLQPLMDPLDSEVESMTDLSEAELSELGTVFTEDTSSFQIGEIPAVQDRFHAIIKRRLRTEIERNPPLFPWETSLWDYESETSVTEAALPWMTQLQTLKLPVQLPEGLLLQIFAACRQVVHSSWREGIKLVRAVEDLFPGEVQALHHWAGQVLAEPVRSASQTLDPAMLPPTYEAANSTQQMVLSLLAAQQVLVAMTLEVSAEAPRSQRQWLTTVGSLTLEADYQPTKALLTIQGDFPAAGSLAIQTPSGLVTATSSEAATLSVELSQPELGQTYGLVVTLTGEESSALEFAVRIADHF